MSAKMSTIGHAAIACEWLNAHIEVIQDVLNEVQEALDTYPRDSEEHAVSLHCLPQHANTLRVVNLALAHLGEEAMGVAESLYVYEDSSKEVETCPISQ